VLCRWCGESEAELRRVFMFGSSWRERPQCLLRWAEHRGSAKTYCTGWRVRDLYLFPRTLGALVPDEHVELPRLLPTALWRLASPRCRRCRCRRLDICAMLHRTYSKLTYTYSHCYCLRWLAAQPPLQRLRTPTVSPSSIINILRAPCSIQACRPGVLSVSYTFHSRPT
jgi:hypothetical protein